MWLQISVQPRAINVWKLRTGETSSSTAQSPNPPFLCYWWMRPVISSRSNRGFCWSGKWTHVLSEWANKWRHVPINAQNLREAARLGLLKGKIALTTEIWWSWIPRGEKALDYCANCFPPPKQSFECFIPDMFRMAWYSFLSNAGSGGDKQSLIILLCFIIFCTISFSGNAFPCRTLCLRPTRVSKNKILKIITNLVFSTWNATGNSHF